MSIAKPIAFRSIEEAALRAWPAAQQLLYDGWVARLSDGYTKRANSALLLYPQVGIDPAANVPVLERLYRSQGLPVICRLLSFATPPELDVWLEKRGYRRADETVTMIRTIEDSQSSDPAVRQLDLEHGIEAHARMNDLSVAVLPGHRRILERIPGGVSFFGLFDDEELVACGLSVVDGDLAGLFDIVTDPAHRRKGHGARLIDGILAQTRRNGAATAYLQVVAANAPATALYRSLGFVETHRYHYRILD